MRYKFQNTFTDQAGNILSEGTIVVFLAGGVTVASVYEADSGGSAVNSVTSDSSGYFAFWVDDSDYSSNQEFKIVLSKTNFTDQTYDEIAIYPFASAGYVDTVKATSLSSVNNTDYIPVAGDGLFNNIITKGPWIDIRAHGGVGDNSTDNATALAAAITASAGTSPIYIPDGTNGTFLFKSATTITQDNTSIIGPGTLKMDAASFAAQTPFIIIQADDVTIDGPTIDGDSNTTGWMLQIGGAASSKYNTKIKNCIFVNGGQASIVIEDNAVDTYIEYNYQKTEGYGVLANNPSGVTGIFISHNHFEYSGGSSGHGDGIELNCPTSGASNFRLIDNTISGYINGQTNHGLGIGCANVSDGIIALNTIENCESDGIHVENGSDDILISSNRVKNIGLASHPDSVGHGIAVHQSSHVRVLHNDIDSTVEFDGIIVSANPGTAAEFGNEVFNNKIQLAGRFGIRLEGQQDFTCDYNKIFGASQVTTATWDGISTKETTTSSPACKNGSIRNNLLKDAGGKVMLLAIDIPSTTNLPSDIYVDSNNIIGCTNKISVVSTSTAISERNNRITAGIFNVSTYGANQALKSYEMYDHTIIVTAAAELELPRVQPGMKFKVYSITSAAVSIDAHVNDRIILNGTALDDGDKITSASGAGDWIELRYESANGWITVGRSGTWTDGGA